MSRSVSAIEENSWISTIARPGDLHTLHMFSSFAPRLEILPPPQRRLWDELGATPSEFVLYGGTAIALYLGHRHSVDFDFFGDRPLDANNLTLALPYLNGAAIIQREPNTLSCIVERGGPVKMSFFGVPRLRRLRDPLVAADNGLQVASLLDLAAAKARVVQLRAEARDYIDLDALVADGRIDLPSALGAALAIYGAEFNPQITLKALVYFEEDSLRRLPREVRNRLTAAVRAVDLDRLPVFGRPPLAGRGRDDLG